MVATASKRSTMTLYSSNTDIYCHRVRIVLAEKGVAYEVIDVDTSEGAHEELANYNPYGYVPTLVDRDLVLYESEIIMEYLDERFPHPPLLPVYPVAKGRSRLVINRVNRDWYTQVNKIYNASSETEKNAARQALSEGLTSVIPVFQEMPFFLSEEFSLVDCCILPILWRLPSLGVELPAQASVVLEYAERLFKRESFQTSLTEEEKALRV